MQEHITAPHSSITYLSNDHYTQSTRLYKVKFSEKELLVRASDLSQAEHDNGVILSIEVVETQLYTSDPLIIAQKGTDVVDFAENPITEEWRKGPNWT